MHQMINGQVVEMTPQEIKAFEAARAAAISNAIDLNRVKADVATLTPEQRDELLTFAASLP